MEQDKKGLTGILPSCPEKKNKEKRLNRESEYIIGYQTYYVAIIEAKTSQQQILTGILLMCRSKSSKMS